MLRGKKIQEEGSKNRKDGGGGKMLRRKNVREEKRSIRKEGGGRRKKIK